MSLYYQSEWEEMKLCNTNCSFLMLLKSSWLRNGSPSGKNNLESKLKILSSF